MPRALLHPLLPRLALSALLAALGGCATTEAEGPTNTCASDDDCASGTCQLELGMCVTAPRSRLRVGLEIQPATNPYGGSVVPVSFEPFDVTGPAVRELQLPVGVPATALLTDVSGEPVTADVTFALESAIPGGAPVQIEARARSERMRDGRDGYQFNLAAQLLPGEIYDVSVQPTGEWRSRLPPLRFQGFMSAQGPHRLDDWLRYPQPCSAEEVAAAAAGEPHDACLHAIEGTVVDAEGLAQPGMFVRVIDVVSGRVLSSTYATGSDDALGPGDFRVVLDVDRWVDQESWLFQITPTSQRVEERGPSPSFAVAPIALFEDDGRITIQTPDASSVVTYTGFVERGATDAGVEGATLSFRATDVADDTTGVVGSFRTSATTGEGGLFEVELLPGTYQVLVTPTDPELGILEQEVIIGGGESVSGQVFALPERTRLQGIVQTGAGLGMLDARVRAQTRGIDLGGMLPPIARYARSNSALTDLDGRFGFGLDVGVYDLIIEPPAGSNFPWLVQPDQAIGGSDAPLSNVYELENPVTLTGTAVFGMGDDRLPVANGEIRAYAVLETGGGTRAVPIGRTTTDETGHYTLLLPPSL
jgi:hypothetical protein